MRCPVVVIFPFVFVGDPAISSSSTAAVEQLSDRTEHCRPFHFPYPLAFLLSPVHLLLQQDSTEPALRTFSAERLTVFGMSNAASSWPWHPARSFLIWRGVADARRNSRLRRAPTSLEWGLTRAPRPLALCRLSLFPPVAPNWDPRALRVSRCTHAPCVRVSHG